MKPNEVIVPRYVGPTTIQWKRISELKLCERNPRTHRKSQLRQLGKSIQRFGFIVPPLVDQHSQVIVGHGRIMAASEVGMLEVPVIQINHLSEPQIQAYRIADNKLGTLSRWDDPLLAEQLQELLEIEPDLTLEALGFEIAEIDLLIQGLGDAASADVDPADGVVDGDEPAVSSTGDLWLLGRHRFLCGNALDAESYNRLTEGKRASMVITDPPYNVPIKGNVSGLGKRKHRDFLQGSGELTQVQYTEFLRAAFRLMAASTREGSLHYVFGDWRHMLEYLHAGKSAYAGLVNLAVWKKNQPGMGAFLRSQHELCYIFKHGSVRHRNNIRLGKFGRARSNVWEYPSANAFSKASDEGNLAGIHPTVKPVRMIADAMLDSTKAGDIVLDTFAGSGTCFIAAERVGRVAYAIELDPRYLDVAIRRWQRYTGAKARHAISGRLFNESDEVTGLRKL